MYKKTYALVLIVLACLNVFSARNATANLLNGREIATCDQASLVAASRWDVPLTILKAIARTESGTTQDGTFAPWPWSVNIEGRGKYLSSKQNAERFVRAALNNGYTNIDIGCFQINYRWHGENFSSVNAMLDPVQNAHYAAEFLSSLHQEFGNWESAAGAYHSRNKRLSEGYLRRFRLLLASLERGGTPSEVPSEPRHSPNTYPLLVRGGTAQLPGSLFSSSAEPRNRFIAHSSVTD